MKRIKDLFEEVSIGLQDTEQEKDNSKEIDWEVLYADSTATFPATV